jgi:excisionase family DNA binding protein
MQLTLQQAAAALGKTRRQVQYLILQGRLPATKVGGRWYVESTDLEADPAAGQRAQQRQGQLQAAVEDALQPGRKARRYSLRDLKAFQIMLPLYARLRQTGAAAPAIQYLKTALEQLAQGCHRFGRSEKTSAYRAARDAASLAVLELLLDDDRTHEEVITALEDDFMAALAGLLRRVDRSRSNTWP